MIKKIFFISLFFPFLLNAQDGLRQQYQFNYLSLNPAFTGESGNFNVVGILGNQFNGTIQFNQISQVISVDGQLYKKNNGLGFQGYRSNYGTYVTSGANLTYAYSANINDVKIKIGTDVGIINIPYVNVSSFTQNIKPYAGLGALVNYDGFTAGFSAPMLISSKDLNENKPFLSQLIYTNEINDYFGLAFSSVLEFDDKNSNKKSGIDFNLKTWFSEVVGLGLSYRSYSLRNSSSKFHAWVPSLEVKLGDYITLGAAYNSNSFFNLGTIQQNDGTFGVFQLLVRYNSNPNKDDFGVLRGF